MLERKNIVIIAVLAFAVLAVGAYLYSRTGESPEAPEVTNTGSSASSIPDGTPVPSPGDKAPENVAVPQIEIPAAPSADSSLRTFALSISGGKLTPANLIVRVGDTVHLDLLAVGANYDIRIPTYGLSLGLPKGQQKVLEFAAIEAGDFDIFCSACGEAAVGKLKVVAQ